MPRIFCIILFSLVCVVAVANDEYSVCDPYIEFNEELSCSAPHYFTEFGYKYCRVFIERKKRFSENARKVLVNIRECLINEMASEPQLTCENAKSKALEHHQLCYVSQGFCDISFVDKYWIYKEVRSELRDPEFRSAFKKVRKACKGNSL